MIELDTIPLTRGDKSLTQAEGSLTQADEPQTQGNEPITTKPKRSIKDAFGIQGLLILAIGTLCLVVPLIILGLLWHGSMLAAGGADPGQFWVRIAFSNWATRTVTVCSAVIRTAMGLQGGLLTAMVASLILERVGVRLEDAALLAMVRNFKIGPETLILPSSHIRKILLRIVSTVTLVFVALLLLSSQFTSTILLSDFALAIVQGQYNDTWMAPFGISTSGELNPNYFGYAVDLWRSRPVTWSRFAEYTEQPETGNGFDDTGTTIRAFLPISNQTTRETLRQYTGPATLIDSRVVCTSPGVLLNSQSIDVPNTSESADESKDVLTLWGNLTFDNSYPAVWTANPTRNVSFYCAVPIVDNEAQGLQVSVCTAILKGHAMALSNADESSDEYPALHPLDYTLYQRTYPDTTVFLVLSTTGTKDAWNSVKLRPFSFSRTDGEGPWNTATVTTAAGPASVSLTACMTILDSLDYNVSVNSSSDMQEAVLKFDPKAKTYQTQDIRNQLGALAFNTSESTSTPLNNRGILTLRQPWAGSYLRNENISNGLEPYATDTYFTDFIPHSLPRLEVAVGIGGVGDPTVTSPTAPSHVPCGYFTLMEGWTSGEMNQVDRAHATLFQDILNTTQSPARALQAVLTTLSQMSYYEYATLPSPPLQGLVPKT